MKKFQRDEFIKIIYKSAKKNRNIYFLSADFGAPALDVFRKNLKNQFIHLGICEQNMVDFGCGLALENKKVYLQVDKNDSRATKIADNGDKMISSVTVEEALKEFDKEKYQPFLIKIDIEGFEKELFSKNYDWIDYFEVIIIEIHDWMIFRKSNSYTFLSALVDVMNKKNKRDLLISGENLVSIKI